MIDPLLTRFIKFNVAPPLQCAIAIILSIIYIVVAGCIFFGRIKRATTADEPFDASASRPQEDVT